MSEMTKNVRRQCLFGTGQRFEEEEETTNDVTD
jgi:hypothetical protein